MTSNRKHARTLLPLMIAAIVALPLLAACDRTESKSKTTTTRVTETPDSVKKTTETTEKKVEKSP
jgi:hypothetical protein